MKKNFTLGAIAGITGMLIAVPLLAQVSSAATATATSSSAAVTGRSFTRPVPTQQQVTDMAARDAAFLKNIDAFVTIQKSAMQAHQTALTAAAAITDDAQRQAAVQKAHEDMRTAIQNAIAANEDLQSAMMPFGHHGFGGPKGPGRGFGRGFKGQMNGQVPSAQ